jgi:hypothetical protein
MDFALIRLQYRYGVQITNQCIAQRHLGDSSMKRRNLLLSLCAALVLTAGPLAHADALDDIVKAGVLKVAVPQDFPPFGSVGTDL